MSCSNDTDFNLTGGMLDYNDTAEGLFGSPTLLHFNDSAEMSRRGLISFDHSELEDSKLEMSASGSVRTLWSKSSGSYSIRHRNARSLS